MLQFEEILQENWKLLISHGLGQEPSPLNDLAFLSPATSPQDRQKMAFFAVSSLKGSTLWNNPGFLPAISNSETSNRGKYKKKRKDLHTQDFIKN